MIQEFSLVITKASFDAKTGERRFLAVASDTDRDSYGQYMSLELFNDFIERAESGEEIPVEFRSEYWSGGMPYLSLSHYPDKNGKLSLGKVTSLYVDGNRLKAKGVFHNTPLGIAAYESVKKSLHESPNSLDDTTKKIRISIGFLDWKHRHGDEIFERQSLNDACPKCKAGQRDGMVFLSGHLIHLALTRVPVNKRTDIVEESEMADIRTKEDDAVSIVGEEVFNSEVAPELVERSEVSEPEALVIKSEEVPVMVDLSEVMTRLSSIQTTVNALVEKMDKPMCEDDEEDEDDMEMKACKKKNKGMYKSMIAFFKSVTEIMEQGGSSDAMLTAIQTPFNQLGEMIKETAISLSKISPEPVAAVEQKSELSVEVLRSLIQEAVRPLQDQIGLLQAQAAVKPATDSVQPPQRALTLRSIPVQPLVESRKGLSPREIAERSTGMRVG